MIKNDYKFYGTTTVYYLYDKTLDMFFKGVAVCSPTDKYDKELGMRIAKLKAICKLRNFNANLFDNVLTYIDEVYAERDKVVEQSKYWHDKAEESFSKLVEITNEM